MVNPVKMNQFSTHPKKYIRVRAVHQHSPCVCVYECIKRFKHIALNGLSAGSIAREPMGDLVIMFVCLAHHYYFWLICKL